MADARVAPISEGLPPVHEPITPDPRARGGPSISPPTGDAQRVGRRPITIEAPAKAGASSVSGATVPLRPGESMSTQVDSSRTPSNPSGRPPLKSTVSSFGNAPNDRYREVFFERYPDLKGLVKVHHAVEQQTLKLYPDQVTPSQIHSIENLRGIPNEKNSDLHLSKIRIELNRFYRANPHPTAEQLLKMSDYIDSKYGSEFLPRR
jgi:hypothetical protein